MGNPQISPPPACLQAARRLKRVLWRRWTVVAAGTAAIGLIAGWIALHADLPEVPSFQEVRDSRKRSDTILLDRKGEPLQEIRTDLHGRRLDWTPLGQVSPALTDAVLRTEDHRFFKHGGIDWLAIMHVGWEAATLRGVRGASTVTMQLAAIVGDVAPRGHPVGRKWRQMRLALSLEEAWSKEQILEGYLNLVSFRGELQGVAAASRGLFGKQPHGLTRAEAFVMAALIRSPNASLDRVLARALVLAQDSQANAARIRRAAEASLQPRYSVEPLADWAPHAARRLIRGADQGSSVHSTLDAGIQRAVVEYLDRSLRGVREQNVHDGAVLVVENATGNVLAYVGGSGDLSSARYVDGVQAFRQAGSTLKPFLYALSFEQRILTPASLLHDSPLEVSVERGVYRPENYDRRFHGTITARTALASSLNIPAVHVVQTAGVPSFLRKLRDLGFRQLAEPDFYGPSLALGAADVTLWDLVNAYRSLANGGLYSPLRMQVPGRSEGAAGDHPDGGGNATGDAPAGSDAGQRRVFSAEAVFLVADILADRESRSAGFGLENALATRYRASVKTGTSKDMRDNWCVGFNRDFTVGVWVGNFSGEPMWDVSGITGAAPVWLQLMNHLESAYGGGEAKENQDSNTQPPPGIVSAEVAFEDGKLRREWFIRGTVPLRVEAAPATEQGDRILSPSQGTIFAIDPDIPADSQRVVFERRPAPLPRHWRLDGVFLDSDESAVFWTPLPGRHKLEITDAQGSVLDAVLFQVRGSRTL